MTQQSSSKQTMDDTGETNPFDPAFCATTDFLPEAIIILVFVNYFYIHVYVGGIGLEPMTLYTSSRCSTN